MSNSNLVTYTHISPNRTSPRNKPITKITIHHMAVSYTHLDVYKRQYLACSTSWAKAVAK